MSNGLRGVSVVTFLAVMTVASGSVVTALKTHASAFSSGQFVQFHVEATSTGVKVALTGYKTEKQKAEPLTIWFNQRISPSREIRTTVLKSAVVESRAQVGLEKQLHAIRSRKTAL